MAFQELKPIETADTYLDIAITRAKKKSRQLKVKGTKINKIKTLELGKITIVRDILASKLDEILHTFPRVEELSIFYQKLLETTIGKRAFKRALGKVNWSRARIDDIFKQYNKELRSAKEIKEIYKLKKAFYGRISSIMENPDYKFLIKARITLQSFPTIRKKLKQIAIAGFPNVGKSTLLSKISKSKPAIAAYPFTTKKTMIGYIEKDNKKIIQLLDTPGTLNRFNKMNYIEQQAFLIMKLVADKIIYIFDLTEPYPLKDQEKLLKRLKELKKPIIIYLSKTDILEKEKIEEFKKRYKAITNIKELKKLIS